ncbi:MAG: flavin reductase [Magnetospirillum sp.]|nr:flavin reductase [Magnetospirillum sp.]
MPEAAEAVARDSRWPAFFPSPLSLLTVAHDGETAMEREVGASIVNRFPLIVAVSVCRDHLSDRHHTRGSFSALLERAGTLAVQFVAPGPALDAALGAIATLPEHETGRRLAASGLSHRPARGCPSPVLDAAYLVYECRLAAPGKDFDGLPIFPRPFRDVGSHRIYFLEVTAIQLREDIARGQTRIHWRSLPTWEAGKIDRATCNRPTPPEGLYLKSYTPDYRFPVAGTIAFEWDELADGMAIKHLPSLPEGQVEIDNDRARWPAFFPSPLGMITCWGEDGRPNIMPCGSTTVVSRHPMTIAACISYSAINQRYAPRASLRMIEESGWFGCGVGFIDDTVVEAIRYTGTRSLAADPDKARHSGLDVAGGGQTPVLSDLPIHFECQVVDVVRLGTHKMFLGEVRRIAVRRDLTPEQPMCWLPWARLEG